MKSAKSIIAAALFTCAVTAQAQSEFFANLSGNSEVPPVATAAFGSATFDVNFSGGVFGINYHLVVNNIKDAFMAHLHCGSADTNGPISVWLAGSPGAPDRIGYDLNGPWVGNAKFKEANIVPNTGCGDTLGDLIAAMAGGRVYVNVHTVGNGGGEIRGQIAPVAALSIP